MATINTFTSLSFSLSMCKMGVNIFWDNNFVGSKKLLDKNVVWSKNTMVKFVGAETEWSACTMGKRGPPLANTIFGLNF